MKKKIKEKWVLSSFGSWCLWLYGGALRRTEISNRQNF